MTIVHYFLGIARLVDHRRGHGATRSRWLLVRR